MPHAVEVPDRIPKRRYFDADFYELEVERLWSRVWQMACRLEEIPAPGDFVEYEIFDQSIAVVHTPDRGVVAFQNACRHRGVKVVEGRGNCGDRGFRCPFHGWCYGPDGTNTAVTQRRIFSDHNLVPEDLDLVPVRCEVWGGCAWINFDTDAPPVRECLEPAATDLDAWKVDRLHAEKWYACRLPVNWKLAIEAFVEMYHVVQTHPQLVIPTRFGMREGAEFDPKAYIDADIQYLRAMSEGMDGMTHPDDVRVAESLRDIELPADAALAIATWNRTLNDAVVAWHRERGHDIPDLNELDEAGLNLTFFHGFPHFFVLPMYSSASGLPVPTVGTGGDAHGDLVARPVHRGPGAADAAAARGVGRRRSALAADPRAGLLEHPAPAEGPARGGSSTCACRASSRATSRTSSAPIDGFLAGLPHEQLLPAVQAVNVYPFEQPIQDLGF